MTKTTLLVATIAILLTVTITTSTVAVGQAAPEDKGDPRCAKLKFPYTNLERATAEQQGNSALKLSVDTCGDIPRFADSFIDSQIVFGYAWLDTRSKLPTGVVAAIHPTFDDSNQNPHAWHTHTVTLAPQSKVSDFCITELGTSQGGLSLHGDVMRLNMAENQAGINAGTMDLAASFVVVSDKSCRDTGLGMNVITAVPIKAKP